MKEIKPSNISGHITIPASKSVVQRAVAAAMLADGTSTIFNPSNCNDCRAALSIAQNLGATVDEQADRWIITGNFQPSQQTLSCGEAGLGIRMFTPILATLGKSQTITGEGSLLSRPMTGIDSAIEQLGGQCATTDGHLPITVCGPLNGGEITVDGSLSSQILTGLLMAAPLAKADVTINVTNLKSKPYIDMTLDVMRQFGIEVVHDGYTKYSIKHGQRYKACDIFAEGDWSGAAFFCVAAAINGHLTIENISMQSKQADKAIIDAIKLANGKVSVSENRIEIEASPLQAFSFDATDCPDLFPPLAVLAAGCKGTTLLKGVSRLIHKESNRANAIQQEFGKAGISVEIEGNGMLITGARPHGCTMSSHNDHRMAMAAAILALSANGPVYIEEPECVSKSYPEFFDHLSTIIQ